MIAAILKSVQDAATHVGDSGIGVMPCRCEPESLPSLLDNCLHQEGPNSKGAPQDSNFQEQNLARSALPTPTANAESCVPCLTSHGQELQKQKVRIGERVGQLPVVHQPAISVVPPVKAGPAASALDHVLKMNGGELHI